MNSSTINLANAIYMDMYLVTHLLLSKAFVVKNCNGNPYSFTHLIWLQFGYLLLG